MAGPDCLTRPAAMAENAATPTQKSVPLKMKIRPSSTNAAALCGESDATNCGRNARKNSATFGLSALVRAPCKNTCRSETAPPSAIVFKDGACGRDSNILPPIKQRYAAPAHFRTVNAPDDAASRADRPTAAPNT